MIDGDGVAARMKHGAKSQETELGISHFKDPHAVARILCAWQQGVEGYRMLHMGKREGQPAPIMRRLARAPRKPVVIVGYDQLILEKQGKDIKLVDVYSYTQGDFLANLLVNGMDAMSDQGVGGSMDAASALKKSRELQSEGKFAEALGVIDALPKQVHDSRMVQMARLRVADQLSEDAYKQALDELAKLFPNDPSVALVDVDGAFLRHDYTKALADIDTIDAAIGGDPFQDAIRASVLLQRNQPGDYDKAAAAADKAITTEPTLAKGWWSRLDVAVKRKDYKLAVETMQHLREHFSAKLDPDALAKLPDYAAFLASDEYKAYAAK
jgi:tetratricopeptide (TPR) repeat protein